MFINTPAVLRCCWLSCISAYQLWHCIPTSSVQDYHNRSVLYSDARRHLLKVLAKTLSTRLEWQQVDQLFAKLSLDTMYICKLFTSSHAPSQVNQRNQFTVEFNN